MFVFYRFSSPSLLSIAYIFLFIMFQLLVTARVLLLERLHTVTDATESKGDGVTAGRAGLFAMLCPELSGDKLYCLFVEDLFVNWVKVRIEVQCYTPSTEQHPFICFGHLADDCFE